MHPGFPKRYRFDVFEFIVSTGELLRHGHKLRLSDQQARLLVSLLHKHGEVLTRQDLRERLWPGGDHLDHDHAIRNAINQLRAVLRDSPQKPRFIETLPKRGYRFVAKVEEIFAAPAPIASLPIVPSPISQSQAPPESVPLTAIEALRHTAESAPGAESNRPPTSFSRKRQLWLAICALFLLAASFAVYRWTTQARATHGSPGVITLGIAPIETAGTAASQIAEPFRSELMDAASQLPGVEVRATHSFPAPAALGDLHELAQELQLDALLLGRIEAKDANHFDFVFELVRGSDAVHLASMRYSGTAAQLAATRDHIQRDLFLHLNSAIPRRLTPMHSTDNPEAYSAYLSGRAQLIRHDDAAIHQAVSDFLQATQIDPGFAQAFAGLGSAYLIVAEHASQGREEAYRASHDAAAKSISLNPNLGEAHATLGFLAFRHDWNATASEAEFRRSIELDPNQAMHRILYALLLCNTGRTGAAFEQIAAAHAADPLWPPVYITEIYVASAAGQSERALEVAHTLVEMMPTWPLAYDQSAWAYWYAGRHEQAVQEWIRMATIEHDQPRLALEQHGLSILRKQGTTAYAHYKLEAIQHNPNWNHPNDFQPAEWQINAGQYEEALNSLQKMVKSHDPESLQLSASPAYLKLHGNPRFNELLKQVGLHQQ